MTAATEFCNKAENPLAKSILALMLLFEMGCGQMGPLYLPRPPLPHHQQDSTQNSTTNLAEASAKPS